MKQRCKQAFGGGKFATASLIFFFLSALFLSPSVSAQEKWRTAIRTGVNFPLKKLGATDLTTGFGFDGSIGYRVMPHLFVNAGWGRNHFGAKNASAKTDYEETGYLMGVQFVHPIVVKKLSYVIGAGALYHHIEVENSSGEIIYNTGHGWGWQADAGLAISLGKRTHLIPSVRYHFLSRDLKESGSTNAVDLEYLSGGVSVAWSF